MLKFKNRQELGWCFYDWANSAFATTVMAGFFPVFFKNYWCQGMEVTKSTAILGMANSLSGFLVAAIAPIIGAIADSGSYKKRFLIFFAYLGVLSTTALFMVQRGNWLFAAVAYTIGTVGFSGSVIFYDSILPLITNKKRIDYVSALGYAMGYLGGGILFAFNIWMILHPAFFGLKDANHAIRISFLTVAAWWGIFTLPIIFFVKEPVKETRISPKFAFRSGLKQLTHTLHKIQHMKTIILFLTAYWLYIDGVDTIVRMGVDYGLSIGFEYRDLLLALLITQFVSFPCAIVFGKLGERIGAKHAIFIAIGVYFFAVMWAMRMKATYEFYGLAILIGLVQGGIQAMSRSFYSRLIPHDQLAEFYGFYNMVGKFAVILGPVLIGITGIFFESSRMGIASIVILFIAGGVLLFFVDEKKGAEQIKYLSLRENGQAL
ncbi:MAG: MFS transporter [Planctomycetia bacterium]|uniref:MFS transporter n=1 Tax=Candidatus Kuenenia sp. TaxID=2499824 RepID=UPI001D65A0A8|nr:MFS transporter [Planctomycetia bacterium]